MTLDAIIKEADIVELIRTYFPLETVDTQTYRALCPFHDDKTPSFVVSRSAQSYQCSTCGVSGTVVDFIRTYEHADEERALRMLTRWLDKIRRD